MTPGAAHRKRRGLHLRRFARTARSEAQRTRIDLTDTVGHDARVASGDLPERIHIDAETTVGGMGHHDSYLSSRPAPKRGRVLM